MLFARGSAMRIVCVHGIGQQLLGERELLSSWVPSLYDGVTCGVIAEGLSQR